MADEIDVEEAAAKPKKASGDWGSVENPSLPELIEADKHAEKKRARSNKRNVFLDGLYKVKPGTAD